MRLIALIGFAAVVGSCEGAPQPAESNRNRIESEPRQITYVPTRVAPPKFDAKGRRIFTAKERAYHPISRYAEFPKAIAALMQQADIEQGWCKGFGDDPETFRACNRSEILHYKLMRRGYCSGSEEPMAAAAEYRWLECSKEANYDPNRPIGEPHQFSEEYIAEIERSSNERAGQKIDLPKRD